MKTAIVQTAIVSAHIVQTPIDICTHSTRGRSRYLLAFRPLSKHHILWLPSNCQKHLSLSFSSVAEAEAKYGKDKLKIYSSTSVSLYHAMTERKTKTVMKLICLLPEEKVRQIWYRVTKSPNIVSVKLVKDR